MAPEPATAPPATSGDESKTAPVSVRMPLSRDLPEESADEFWFDFFVNNEPSAAAVRTRVRSLADEERFDHVEAIINATLINGQSQPWMYEVLAIAMEINGRPRKEIERVALSMADFGQANYDSMVQSATFLTAFKRPESALKMLKQASMFDPDRPEAFLAALPLVERTRSTEAAAWALPGVLSTVWGEGSEPVRENAATIARRFERSLTRSGSSDEAKALATTIAAAAIPDVRVRLDWNGEADLDLAVLEPPGTKCFHGNARTPAGGILLGDGFGPGRPAEEYVCPRGYPGSYLVEVSRSVGQPVGKRATLVIEVRQADGTVRSEKQALDTSKEIPPVRFELEKGRRTAPQQVGAAIRPERGRRPGSRPVIIGEAAPVRAGAIGIAPQIGVVSEGVSLQATPVVSPDRRYVRIGLQPWFQNITDVQTFSFIGPQPANGNANGQ